MARAATETAFVGWRASDWLSRARTHKEGQRVACPPEFLPANAGQWTRQFAESDLGGFPALSVTAWKPTKPAGLKTVFFRAVRDWIGSAVRVGWSGPWCDSCGPRSRWFRRGGGAGPVGPRWGWRRCWRSPASVCKRPVHQCGCLGARNSPPFPDGRARWRIGLRQTGGRWSRESGRSIPGPSVRNWRGIGRRSPKGAAPGCLSGDLWRWGRFTSLGLGGVWFDYGVSLGMEINVESFRTRNPERILRYTVKNRTDADTWLEGSVTNQRRTKQKGRSPEGKRPESWLRG